MAPSPNSPRTQEAAAAALNAHALQVWQGLTPQERGRAGQLIARLTAEERAAWLAALAQLPVPEAVAHARAVISAPPQPAQATPLLAATTPQGDPS